MQNKKLDISKIFKATSKGSIKPILQNIYVKDTSIGVIGLSEGGEWYILMPYTSYFSGGEFYWSKILDNKPTK